MVDLSVPSKAKASQNGPGKSEETSIWQYDWDIMICSIGTTVLRTCIPVEIDFNRSTGYHSDQDPTEGISCQAGISHIQSASIGMYGLRVSKTPTVWESLVMANGHCWSHPILDLTQPSSQYQWPTARYLPFLNIRYGEVSILITIQTSRWGEASKIAGVIWFPKR